MEDQHCCNHTEHIAQRDHRVGHAEGVVLDDIEPEDGACCVEEAAKGKVPVREQRTPEMPGPSERFHPAEGKFQENLSDGKQQTLYDG